MVAKEEEWGEKMGSLGLAVANYTHRMNKQKAPTVYSTGNYVQYPGINHNGKEYKNECIHMCNSVTLQYT